MIDDEAEGFIVDPRFQPHLTIFKSNTMDDTSKVQLAESVIHTSIGSFIAKGITLRVKKDKTKNQQPEVLLTASF